jgi:hypothetical protein
MLSPALLVIFVTSSAQIDPATVSLERAAHEVLGPSAELRVEAVASPLSDGAVLERAGPADGVVELHWNGARRTALLHCYIASEQRWVDRAIRFSPADSEPDRGRMLGFAVASMFMEAPRFFRARRGEDASVAQLSGEASVGPTSVAPVEPAVTSPPVPSPRGASAAPSSAGLADTSWSPDRLAAQGVGRNTLEFAGVATRGLGGSSGAEVGALAALGVPLSERLSLHVQLAGRTGELALAQANVRRVITGAGLAWNALPDADRVALRLRVDALGSWFQVSHLSSDDVASVENHGWLFGGDAVVTLGYRISSLLTFSAGIGLEAMSGQTHVFTHGVERATLPALHGLGELGFLTHF